MIEINFIMYAYLFVCMMLLVFNFVYILREKHNHKKHLRLILRWEEAIVSQCGYCIQHVEVDKQHLQSLLKKLSKQGELLAYLDAIKKLNENEGFSIYLTKIYPTLQELADVYAKKDNMNRAFFAYVIACFPSPEHAGVMDEVLLSYFQNATVYCRENVLQAFYAMGDIRAVERALQIMNDRGYFHHQKLLADGLASFQGDKDKLFDRLWTHREDWNENLMVSIIQSIGMCSSKYTTIFLPMLHDESVNIEVRLAMIRYYRHYPYRPVIAKLYAFFDEYKDVRLLIVSAFVLDHYPGEQTIAVLKKAICHENWYVRKNAAKSLMNLQVNVLSLDEIWLGNDEYAKEMLHYASLQKVGTQG